jgi:hypothetical protein
MRLTQLGILLFDSFGPGRISEQNEDDWQYRYSPSYPEFNSTEPLPIVHPGPSRSSRQNFICQFESEEFIQYVLKDDSTIIWAILGIVSWEWASVINKFEIILRDEPTVISSTNDFGDFQLDVITRQTKYLRENREMLKGCLAVIKAYKRPESLTEANALTAEKAFDLAIDFEDLILRTEDHIVRVGRGLAVFASITAIEENRKAIRQAEDIRYSTTLPVNLDGCSLASY